MDQQHDENSDSDKISNIPFGTFPDECVAYPGNGPAESSPAESSSSAEPIWPRVEILSRTDNIKRAIVAAAGDPPEAPWVRGGTERFYFEGPGKGGGMGSVEIDTTETIREVRLELCCSPEMAQQIIRLVVSARPAEEAPTETPVEKAPIEEPFVPPTRDPEPDEVIETGEEDLYAGLPPEVLIDPPALPEERVA